MLGCMDGLQPLIQPLHLCQDLLIQETDSFWRIATLQEFAFLPGECLHPPLCHTCELNETCSGWASR